MTKPCKRKRALGGNGPPHPHKCSHGGGASLLGWTDFYLGREGGRGFCYAEIQCDGRAMCDTTRVKHMPQNARAPPPWE